MAISKSTSENEYLRCSSFPEIEFETAWENNTRSGSYGWRDSQHRVTRRGRIRISRKLGRGFITMHPCLLRCIKSDILFCFTPVELFRDWVKIVMFLFMINFHLWNTLPRKVDKTFCRFVQRQEVV